jgi:alpha-D-xyloside xylohydrolase
MQWLVLLWLSLAPASPLRAAVVSYTQAGNNLTFKLDKGPMRVRVCQPDVVQVQYTVLPAFAAKTSLVVNNPLAQKTPFKVTEKGGQIILTTARLQVRVDKATNAVAYFDLNGAPIASETASGR